MEKNSRGFDTSIKLNEREFIVEMTISFDNRIIRTTAISRQNILNGAYYRDIIRKLVKKTGYFGFELTKMST